MKKKLLLLICVFASACLSAQLETKISIKSPGNPAETYSLKEQASGELVSNVSLPLEIRHQKTEIGNKIQLKVVIRAKELVYYNLEEVYKLHGNKHDDCLFYMPGFWYRRNLRSPQEAPSFYTSDSWQVREDRLSVPLTAVYNEKTGEYFTVLRRAEYTHESLATHTAGEVILTNRTSLGFTGFRNVSGTSSLVFGYPYSEAPKTYIRKLTLAPSVQAFDKLEKGESRELIWEIEKDKANDFSDFVAKVWTYSYDMLKPQVLTNYLSDEAAKGYFADYFTESYVDKYELKYFSGAHMLTATCESSGIAEVGFIGRSLLNAFNALEYGEANNRPDLVKKANDIYESYLNHGFTSSGFFREFVDFIRKEEPNVYSIRRQSEGAFAVLNYLDYEKKAGRKHPEWETKIKTLLAAFAKLQKEDGSFPRKFDNDFKVLDPSGGSTPSATLPLTMAYKYFNDKSYLQSAKKTAEYLEKELISKADYFSSTLDANCEDKEASLYASTAMYYLAMVSKGEERQHYADMCKKSAYFSLSWYYLWDVPFAQGQMLGDVGFKSRGWGNVSVENNHVDVFIFEFGAVLNWLSKEFKEERFADMSKLIRSSMFQLMPHKGHMFDIGRVGYYPEVVQHTNWDYGKNGKGFYNDIFAPGWTVASLWQLLSPNRVENYFNSSQNKKK